MASAPVPSVTLTASSTSVIAGATVELTWSSTNASSCTASDGWSGTQPTSGSAQVGPLTQTTTFDLSCSGSGGSGSGSVTVTVQAVGDHMVGGNLLVSSISRSDGDVNDPLAPYLPNDLPEMAQPLPNPVVLGGYVNKPNHGPDGPSFAAGDLDDWFLLDLSADQVIELLIPSADPALPDTLRDDADLELYDAALALKDESILTGQVETLVVPATGTYYVRVLLFSGSPLYRLSIGQTTVDATRATLRLSDEFVPGQAIVTMKPESAIARQSSAQTLDTRFGLSRVAGDVSRELLLRLPDDAMQRLDAQKSVHSPGETAERAATPRVPAALQRKHETLQYIKRLRTDPSVRFAEPNRIVRTTLEPNDPGYPSQRWHYELIHLPSAWNVTTGSADVTVAIVDTGFADHGDLTPNLTVGYDFVSDPFNEDGDGIDDDPDDPGCVFSGGSVFHGTHVGGTVAAASDNLSGVAGVAWSARLMPLRVIDGCIGSGTSFDVAQGVRYAAGLPNESGLLPNRRADIINLSLGSPGACDSMTASLTAQVRAQGVVIVAAAGNSNTSQLHSPASCPNVIAVSSVGPTRLRAPYSNFGATWVDVAAPGGDTRFDFNGDGLPDGIYSTYATGGGAARSPTLAFLQGTSMAAPHVAGVVALMKSRRTTLTPADVDTLLSQGALTDDIGEDGRDDLGVGLINAFKAVQAAGTAPAPVPATLTVIPSSLNFGSTGMQAAVFASNDGTGALSVTGTTTSASWITVAAAGTDADGLSQYTVTVDRAGLPVGSHSGTVRFVSTANTATVTVLMQVVSVNGEPDAGRQYVLLIDAATKLRVAQLDLQVRGASVAYLFDAVASGDYTIVTGTDMNNDGRVCDDGEACGAYPVEVAPAIVTVDGDRLGLDFTTTYRATVRPDVAASTDDAARVDSKRRGFARTR